MKFKLLPKCSTFHSLEFLVIKQLGSLLSHCVCFDYDDDDDDNNEIHTHSIYPSEEEKE